MKLKTIEETYRERLAMLIEEVGSASALGNLINKNPSQISQWLNGSPNSGTGKSRSMKSATAREIEEIMGKPYGWFDQPVYNVTINGNNSGNQNIGSGNQTNYSLYQDTGKEPTKAQINDAESKFLKSMPVMDMNIAARYLIGGKEDREQIYDAAERTETFIPQASETIGVTVSDNSMIEFSADRIQVGDTLLVEPQMPPRSNDLIFLCINNTGYWRGMICRLKINIDGSRMINHDGTGFIPMPAGAVIGGVIVELKRRFVPAGLLKSRIDTEYNIMQSIQQPNP